MHRDLAFHISRSTVGLMRWFIVSALLFGFSATLQAHHPDRECQPVHPRYDLIGPLGNSLPMSYRRKYNRPRNWGGKIAYHIAPSSQEAMAWHDAKHRCLYENDRPRIVVHYFYPKPWESLRVGARPSSETSDEDRAEAYDVAEELLQREGDAREAIDVLDFPEDQPLVNEGGLIEE